METEEQEKTTPAWRRLLSLAYAEPKEKSSRQQQPPLPGWKFDATVIGLFIVGAIANLL